MEESSTLYMADGWFDSGSVTAGDLLTTYTDGWYTPTYTWSYPVYTKIRLKLSEVEHLRKRCRDDRKLKAIMRKFAPHIEIEVDFP